MGNKISLFSAHIPAHTGWKVYELIKSGRINRGEKAKEFEEKFKQKFDYRYALSVNSCTSALRLSYAMIKSFTDARDGDEIITTPYTMVATNTAMLECGFKPVFADIKYGTANIDPHSIEDHITKKTKAIAIVHYGGYPCDMKVVNEIAIEHSLPVVEDCAQALGAMYDGEFVGQSKFSCFSFQTIKHITTGDGGMLITNRGAIYDEAVKRAWFGINKEERIKNELGAHPVDIISLGYKYAMNDMAATMGIEGLKDFDNVFMKRAEIAKQYREELGGMNNLTLMTQEKGKVSANWMFPIHVKRRRIFATLMRKKGIEVAVHNWRNDKYSIFGGLKNLPETERLNGDLIHIPLHAELTRQEVDYVISTIKSLKW